MVYFVETSEIITKMIFIKKYFPILIRPNLDINIANKVNNIIT